MARNEHTKTQREKIFRGYTWPGQIKMNWKEQQAGNALRKFPVRRGNHGFQGKVDEEEGCDSFEAAEQSVERVALACVGGNERCS